MNGLLKQGNAPRLTQGSGVLINPKAGNKQVKPIAQPVPRDDLAPTMHALPVGNQQPIRQQDTTSISGLLPGASGRLPLSTAPRYGVTPIEQPKPITDAPPPSEGVGNTTPNTPPPPPSSMPTTAERPDTNLETDVNQAGRPESERGDYESVNRPSVEGQDVRDNASVASQLTGLLAEDNPYIQQARQQAAQEAASRGLRNTTMGVQAGQQAAIAQALPIAQQDAQQNFQLQQNEQLQGYQMDQSLYNALLTGERDAVMQQYGLDETQYNAALQQAQMRNQQGFELDRMNYQAQLQSVLNSEQHQHTLQIMDAEQRNSLERMNQEFINLMESTGAQWEHQTRMAYADSSTRVMQSAMEQLGFIYSNPEMTPEQQRNAVNTVMQNLQSQFGFLQGIYEPFPGLDFEPSQSGPPPVPPEQNRPPSSIPGNPSPGTPSPYPQPPTVVRGAGPLDSRSPYDAIDAQVRPYEILR